MAPLIAALVNAGLPLLASAITTKGKEFVEDKLNIKLPEPAEVEARKEALTNIEAAHKEALEQMAVQAYATEVDDRKSARTMQVAALSQDDVVAKRFIYWFALYWSVFTTAYITGITFYVIPVANLPVVTTVLGFLLGTAVATILNFFFGSSFKSREKDNTIEKLSQVQLRGQ